MDNVKAMNDSSAANGMNNADSVNNVSDTDAESTKNNTDAENVANNVGTENNMNNMNDMSDTDAANNKNNADAASNGDDPLAPDHATGVIDCHCHVYPAKIAERAVDAVGDFYGIHMDVRDGTTDGLLRTCANSPVERFVIHSVATRPDQVTSINDFIANECAAHPEFVGFMTLHQDLEDPEREVNRAIGMGLKGIKLHPDTQKVDMDDVRLLDIYEIAQAKRLPIIMHCGDYRYDYSHPRRMKRILKAFPDLVVDAAHFGGWSLFDLALEYLQDENCFLDMSSSMAFLGLQRTKELTRAYGTDRIMFGSDFPMWNPADELRTFGQIGFSESEWESLTRDNARRFLGEI